MDNDEIKKELLEAVALEMASEESSGVEVAAEEEAGPVQPQEAAADFSSFGFCDELMRGIDEAGFREPTPIQRKAIPYALAGRDLLGQALTGTGKTAAFGLPSMQRIMGVEGLQMLVLTPTRELAAQISSELYKLGKYTGLKPAAFTGGQSYSRQEELLRRGLNILVATPGRLLDLMESGHFDEVNPSVIVVDEADEMLDMGFIDDVREIFDHFEGPHQTMLFSATMPKQVVHLAETILNDPLNIETECPEVANNGIEQCFFVIEEFERSNAVIRLIDSEEVTKAIIFCRTREETDSLNILLGGRGYNVNCLHGDMEQAQRSRVMAAFRRGDFDILVATDVAARGLDVEDVSHVFNYHLPFDSRSYVHRIGRTGRAGKSGKAITLVTPRELRALEAIRKSVGANLSLGIIPSRHEVNQQRLEKLLGQLFASELDPELYHTVCEMISKQDQDPAVLFTKMLSRQLAASADQGPEYIGLPQEKVELLMNRRKRGDRAGRGDRRFSSRRSFRRDEEDVEASERPPRRSYRRDEGSSEALERPPRRSYRRDEGSSEALERPPRRSYRCDEGSSEALERPPRRSYRRDEGSSEALERPPRRRSYGHDEPRHVSHAHGAPDRFSASRPRRRGEVEERPRKEKKSPVTPAIRLNPDGTPKLNRKQRRLLKFGPPRTTPPSAD